MLKLATMEAESKEPALLRRVLRVCLGAHPLVDVHLVVFVLAHLLLVHMGHNLCHAPGM